MLRWVGKKYMEMQKVREENRKNGEMGFTLIELLVVVIIIGILAAIAIPTFLNQRNNAYEAQTKSSIRNGVTNAESFATTSATPGKYTGLDDAAVREGISSANGVTLTAEKVTADSFCVEGVNSNGGGTFSYSKTGANADQIVEAACPA